MTIAQLKTRNQITIPSQIVRKLHLREHEVFVVETEGNYIKLTPVEVEPRYTAEDLKAMDRLVKTEKSKAKVYKPGKDFSEAIKKIAK